MTECTDEDAMRHASPHLILGDFLLCLQIGRAKSHPKGDIGYQGTGKRDRLANRQGGCYLRAQADSGGCLRCGFAGSNGFGRYGRGRPCTSGGFDRRRDFQQAVQHVPYLQADVDDGVDTVVGNILNLRHEHDQAVVTRLGQRVRHRLYLRFLRRLHERHGRLLPI